MNSFHRAIILLTLSATVLAAQIQESLHRGARPSEVQTQRLVTREQATELMDRVEFGMSVRESTRLLDEMEWPHDLRDVSTNPNGVQRFRVMTRGSWVVTLVFTNGEVSGLWLGTCEQPEEVTGA